MVHPWTVGKCIMYTGIRLLLHICPFILHFSFQFSNMRMFCHTFLRNCVETWFTHGQCADVSCIPESGCCFVFIRLFFSFFLPNFRTLKFFVTLFSGIVRPRRLKLGTHVDSGQMYRVYRNQAAAAYSSLYF